METARACFDTCWRDRVKHFREKGYCALKYVSQDPVRYTVPAENFAIVDFLHVFRTSERLDNFGSLAGTYLYALIASLTVSIAAGSDVSSTTVTA
jgi:hypothetical protein